MVQKAAEGSDSRHTFPEIEIRCVHRELYGSCVNQECLWTNQRKPWNSRVKGKKHSDIVTCDKPAIYRRKKQKRNRSKLEKWSLPFIGYLGSTPIFSLDKLSHYKPEDPFVLVSQGFDNCLHWGTSLRVLHAHTSPIPLAGCLCESGSHHLEVIILASTASMRFLMV